MRNNLFSRSLLLGAILIGFSASLLWLGSCGGPATPPESSTINSQFEAGSSISIRDKKRLTSLLTAESYGIDYLFLRPDSRAELSNRFMVPADSTFLTRVFIKPKLEEGRAHAFQRKILPQAELLRQVPDETSSFEKPIILLARNFDRKEEWLNLMYFRWIRSAEAEMMVINPYAFPLMGNLRFLGTAFYEVKTFKLFSFQFPWREEEMGLLAELSIPSDAIQSFEIEGIVLQPGVNRFLIEIPEGTKNVYRMTGSPDNRDLSVAMGKVEFIPIKKMEVKPQEKQVSGELGNILYWISEHSYGSLVYMFLNKSGYEPELLKLNIPLERSFSLSSYSLFKMEVDGIRPDIVQVEVNFGVEVVMAREVEDSQSAVPTRLMKGRYDITCPLKDNQTLEVNLRELVEAELKYYIQSLKGAVDDYRLTELHLLLHKRWGVDCSQQHKGVYTVDLGKVELFSSELTWMVPFHNEDFTATDSIKGVIRSNQVESFGFTVDGGELNGVVYYKDKLRRLADKSLVLVLSVPLPAIEWKSPSYISFEYRVDDPDSEAVHLFLGEYEEASSLGEDELLNYPEMPLTEFVYIGPNEKMSVDSYAARLPSFFPYRTDQSAFPRLIIFKDDREVSLVTRSDWEKGREKIQILPPGPLYRVSMAIEPDDNPTNHHYKVKFIPSQWIGPGAKEGFQRVSLPLEEVFKGDISKLKSINFLFFRKIGDLLPYHSFFTIKDVKFYQKYSGSIVALLAEEAFRDAHLFSVDDHPMGLSLQGLDFSRLLAPESGREPGLENIEEGFWLNAGTLSLAEGEHAIQALYHDIFQVERIQLQWVDEETALEGEEWGIHSPVEPDSREPIKGVRLNFRRINPTKYVVSAFAEKSFWLVFNESYHPKWKAYVRPAKTKGNSPQRAFEGSALLSALRDWGKRTELQEHLRVNVYANGWYVDLSKIAPEASAEREFEIVLEFTTQRVFELGLLFSIITVLVGIGYLIIRYYKKRAGNLYAKVS